jgi:hypothetical protein
VVGGEPKRTYRFALPVPFEILKPRFDAPAGTAIV